MEEYNPASSLKLAPKPTDSIHDAYMRIALELVGHEASILRRLANEKPRQSKRFNLMKRLWDVFSSIMTGSLVRA